MRRWTARTVPRGSSLVVGVFLIALGAVAPRIAWAGSASCGIALLETIQAFLLPRPAWAGSAGRCGGTGGSHQKTLTCPSGQYVVGLQGRGATYVDLVGIACAPIGTNGKRGTVGGFMSAGPGGGTQGGSALCSGNGAVRAIRGKSGVWYDNLVDGACTSRVVATGRFEDRDASRATVEAGGPGGVSCRVGCPSGEVLYSVTVKYGNWVDSVSGQCRP